MASYTDWQVPFKILFETVPIKNVVELGLGEGTAWLLKNAEHVLSVEFVAREEHEYWTDLMVQKYKDCSNWEYYTVKTEDKYSQEVVDTVNKLPLAELVFVDPRNSLSGKDC